MKWRKHSSTERNQIQSKLVRKHFGAEGYGIYQALKEVIAENVEAGNFKEWGSVSRLHDIETLADECMTTPEMLRKFLQFCNEKGIFEKKEGKLFCEQMMDELDEYAEKLRTKYKQYRDTVPTVSVEVKDKIVTTPDSVGPDKKKIRLEEDKKRLEENIPAVKPQVSPKKEISPGETTIQRVVSHLEATLKTKIINWGKQGIAVKKMLRAGYTEKQIIWTITEMEKEDWYQDKGFDLTTVANNIDKYRAKARKVTYVQHPT